MNKQIQITIKQKQYDWFKSKHMNISGCIREVLDSYIKKFEGEIDGKKKESCI